MNYTIYNPVTGQILELFSTSDPAEQSITLTTSSYVPGWYDPEQYYIDGQHAVAKPPRPQGQAWLWDHAAKSWQQDLNVLAQQHRDHRDQCLSHIDKVNAVWYAALSQSQQQELQAYRQALLTVPQQLGFPLSVEWPAKPTWL